MVEKKIIFTKGVTKKLKILWYTVFLDQDIPSEGAFHVDIVNTLSMTGNDIQEAISGHVHSIN